MAVNRNLEGKGDETGTLATIVGAEVTMRDNAQVKKQTMCKKSKRWTCKKILGLVNPALSWYKIIKTMTQ